MNLLLGFHLDQSNSASMRFGFFGDPKRYSKWAEIAHEKGFAFETISLTQFSVDEVQRGFQLIQEADAFVIVNPRIIFTQEPSFAAKLHTRVAEGARLLIHSQIVNDANYQRQAEEFYAHYDMAPTNKRLMKGADSNAFHFNLSKDSGCFVNPQLFAGVREISLRDAYIMWYSAEAFATLIADDNVWVLDVHSDMVDDWRRFAETVIKCPDNITSQFPKGWNARELSIMNVFHNDRGGAVLAVSAELFSNDISYMEDDSNMERNRRLAGNVLDFLCKPTSATTPENLLHQIEVNMADFVLGTVKNAESDWWNMCVPLPMRQKCASRQEEECSRFEKVAYLDFVDLKEIMSKNWRLFEAQLR